MAKKKNVVSKKAFQATCTRLAQEAVAILDQLELLKAHKSLLYSRLDMIVNNVAQDRAEGCDPMLEETLKKHKLFIQDNFYCNNVAYRTTSVRRFELKKETKDGNTENNDF